MQLEAGKKYTDRRGRVYGPLSKDSKFYAEQFGCQLWYDDGRITPGEQFDMDLVAEYVEPVKAAEPEYRMLQDGELIQEGDEYKDCTDVWRLVPSGFGQVFGSQYYWPHRRLVKPAPVESPDDLVIQDRVPERVGIDEWRMYIEENGKRTGEAMWNQTTAGQTWFGRHGDKRGACTMEVRCRRKDLPPVPSQKPVEPEFPQFIIYATGGTFADCAYIVRTSEDDAYSVLANGKRGVDFKWMAYKTEALKSGVWKCVTEQEAEKLVSRTRTVVLKEWLCWDDSHLDFVAVEWSSLDPSSDDHQFEAYDHAHATGNTRTVEIPVT